MLRKRLEQWDQASFCRLFSHSSSKLALQASFWLSKTADGPCYLLLALMLLLLETEHATAFSVLLLCSFALELPLYLLLKREKRLRKVSPLQRATEPKVANLLLAVT